MPTCLILCVYNLSGADNFLIYCMQWCKDISDSHQSRLKEQPQVYVDPSIQRLYGSCLLSVSIPLQYSFILASITAYTYCVLSCSRVMCQSSCVGSLSSICYSLRSGRLKSYMTSLVYLPAASLPPVFSQNFSSVFLQNLKWKLLLLVFCGLLVRS